MKPIKFGGYIVPLWPKQYLGSQNVLSCGVWRYY